MGRSSWSDRKTVEECRSLSISELVRAETFTKGQGYLAVSWWASTLAEEVSSIGYRVKSNSAGGLYLQLFYTIINWFSRKKTPVDYRVELTTTPCNFAGKRYWFVCPLVVGGKRCRRRVGKLYLPPGEIYFGCRNCYNLTYRSCKEHDKRVDALIETPDALLALMRGNDPEGFLSDLKGLRLAVKGYTKILRK